MLAIIALCLVILTVYFAWPLLQAIGSVAIGALIIAILIAFGVLLYFIIVPDTVDYFSKTQLSEGFGLFVFIVIGLGIVLNFARHVYRGYKSGE